MNKGLILLAVLFISTYVYAGGSHTGEHGDQNEKMIQHWQAPKSAMDQVNPVPADNVSVSVGKNVYTDFCVRCHGIKLQGEGSDGQSLTIAPTNLREMAGEHSDGDFAWKIKTGKGDMPAWEDELDEKEIWSLVNYIQSFKNKAPVRHDSHSKDPGHHN